MHFPTLPIIGLTLLTTSTTASSVLRRSYNNLPSPYTYQGCYIDSVSSRQLTGAYYASGTSMTASSCVSFCDSKGFQIAGVEYSSECFCAHQFTSTPEQVASSECNMPCSGDASEACGAANRLSVFTNGKAAPKTNPGVDGYTLLGCYTDDVAARTLARYEPSAAGGSGLTVAKCVATCRAKGFAYAGVEFGGECFCDEAIRNGATTASGCDVVCTGDSSEYCGGSARIDVYFAFGN